MANGHTSELGAARTRLTNAVGAIVKHYDFWLGGAVGASLALVLMLTYKALGLIP